MVKYAQPSDCIGDDYIDDDMVAMVEYAQAIGREPQSAPQPISDDQISEAPHSPSVMTTLVKRRTAHQ